MHLTRKAIAERIKEIDVVIEVLDARLPGSSANPLLAELTGHKPTLKILNKQDVADPERTQQWLDHYNAQPGTRAIARCKLLNNFSIRLARSTRYPMNTNSGIAISTSLDITEYVR